MKLYETAKNDMLKEWVIKDFCENLLFTLLFLQGKKFKYLKRKDDWKKSFCCND